MLIPLRRQFGIVVVVTTAMLGMALNAQAPVAAAQLAPIQLAPASLTTDKAAVAQTRTDATTFTTLKTATCGTYTVRSGDWLSSIGGRVGLSWQMLAQNNALSDPNLIFPGEHINTCGGTSTAASTTTSGHGATTTPTKHTQPVGQSGAPSSVNWGGEPCHSSVYVTGPISAWTVPPSCYAGVYRVNTANYVARSGFGWCTWWPEVLHPSNPRILFDARSSTPAPGAVIVFAPGVQGASAGGHYGEVVAVLSGGWLLISEMNDTWRGAGFGLVNYRYVHLGYGISFIYG